MKKRRPHRPRTNLCDCGGTKPLRAEACDRCAFLDGSQSGASIVIGALRTFGGRATTTDIATFTGLGHRYIYRVLRGLRESGRVRRAGKEVYVYEASFTKPNHKTDNYYELVA